VLQRLAMPDVPRPILAADDDGLWMAPAVNSGGHTVYHVELGASAAVPVFSLPGLQYAAWVVAAGHDVWLDVGSGSTTETLWRLVGASATQLATTGGAGPAVLPTNGTVSYQGTSWLVFSFQPRPSTRVYAGAEDRLGRAWRELV